MSTTPQTETKPIVTRADLVRAYDVAYEADNTAHKTRINALINQYDIDNPPTEVTEATRAPMDDFRTSRTIPTDPGIIPPTTIAAGNPINPMAQTDGPILSELKGNPYAEQTPGGQAGAVYEDAVPALGEMTVNNLDVPGGIGGAMAGSAMGAPFGPPGMIAGSVIGGMIGTAGGVVASNIFADNDNSALDEALEAGAIDTAMYVVASKFKKVGAALGLGKEAMQKMFPQWLAKNVDEMKPVGAGTPESVVQSNALLTAADTPGEKIGGLTAYQTGMAGATRLAGESLAQIGMWSRGMFDKRTAVNAETIQQYLEGMMYKTVNDVQVDGKHLGEAYEGIMKQGRDSAVANYGTGLNAIRDKVGDETVNPQGLIKLMDDFAKGKAEMVGTDLAPEAAAVIDNFTKVYGNVAEMDVKSLLLFKKNLSTDIGGLLDPMLASTSRTKAANQLSDLNQQLNKRFSAILYRVDPESAQAFSLLNRTWGDAMDKMLPPITAKFLTSAEKQAYDRVGSMMVSADADEIAALYRSMDTAFAEVAARDAVDSQLVGSSYSPVADTLIYKNLDEAKQALQNGWMNKTFGELSEGTIDTTLTRFTSLAKRLEVDEYGNKVKAIFGDDYGKFKVIVNAIADMAGNRAGSAGALVLKGKEMGVLGGSVTALAGAAGGGVLPALGTAALWFGTPKMIGFMTSSPAAIKKLLAGKATANAFLRGGNVRAADEAITETLTAIIDMMSPKDKEEMALEMGGE
jgi:hypothetical protein